MRPNSGWFSDRSVCYLASGRPVVTMRTGLSRFYPAGEGLFDYATMTRRWPRSRRSRPTIRATAAPRATWRRNISRSDRVLGARCCAGYADAMTASPGGAELGLRRTPRLRLGPRWRSRCSSSAALLVIATFDQITASPGTRTRTTGTASSRSITTSRISTICARSHFLDLTNYGAAFDMIAAALNLVSPFGTYETRHLLNGLVGVLGLVGAVEARPRAGRAARGLHRRALPLPDAQLLRADVQQPEGHPLRRRHGVGALLHGAAAAGAAAAALARDVVKLGLAVGLTLGVRVGGLMLFGYLGLMLLLSAIVARRARRGAWRVFVAEGWTALWRVLVPAVAVAYPVMLVFWPWAQQAPIANPLAGARRLLAPGLSLSDAVRRAPTSRRPICRGSICRSISCSRCPNWCCCCWSPRRWWPGSRCGAHGWPARARARARLLHAGLRDPLPGRLRDRDQGDAVRRHAAFHLRAAADRRASRRSPPTARSTGSAASRWRRPAYAALALYGVYHVGVMAMLHPDEYVYYNAFVGGVHGARGLFKLDYWANSYAEAVQGLEDYLRAEYGADFMDHDFTVAVCGPPGFGRILFPAAISSTRPSASEAHFFIAFTKDDCDKAVPGKVIYRVERMGTLLSLVHRPARHPGADAAARRRTGEAGVERARIRAPRRRGRPDVVVRAASTPISSPPGAARRRAQARAACCSTPAAAPADFWRGLARRRLTRCAAASSSTRARAASRAARAAAGSSPARSTQLPFADAALRRRSSAPTCCATAASTRRAALAEFRRCLKPGGVLVLNLPAYRWLLSAHDVAVDNVRRYRRGEVRALLGERGLRRGACALLEQRALSADGAAA